MPGPLGAPPSSCVRASRAPGTPAPATSAGELDSEPRRGVEVEDGVLRSSTTHGSWRTAPWIAVPSAAFRTSW